MDINLAFRPEGATHAGKEDSHGSWYKKNDAGDWLFIDMAEDGLTDRSWHYCGGEPGYKLVELPGDARTAPTAPKPVVDGGSAFPTGDNPESQLYAHPGMSLRDYFAARALAPAFPGMSTRDVQYAAEAAYELADAMIAARGAQ